MAPTPTLPRRASCRHDLGVAAEFVIISVAVQDLLRFVSRASGSDGVWSSSVSFSSSAISTKRFWKRRGRPRDGKRDRSPPHRGRARDPRAG
jgi:hypothetical protein